MTAALPWRIAILLLWGAGCDPDPVWTYDAALAPVLARMDQDGNGQIGLREYNEVAYHAPRFDQVDLNSDGALSGDEIRQLILQQDPASFDGQVRNEPDLPVEQPEIFHPDPWERRVVKEVFLFWNAEIRARATGIVLPQPLPTPEEIDAATAAGSLSDPACTALLRRLSEDCGAVGLELPAGLRP